MKRKGRCPAPPYCQKHSIPAARTPPVLREFLKKKEGGMRLALVLATALLFTGCDDLWEYDDYQADFHYHYDFQPGGRIEVDNPNNGSVEIEGWDRNTVDVSGMKFASRESSLEALRIDVHNSPGSIVIRTMPPPFHRAWARYTIRVPRKTAVERVSTVNGHILLRNLDAIEQAQTAHLKTVNGSIEANDVHSAIEAQTVNGHIELRDIGGAVTMRGWNGRLEAERIDGACEARSVNGSITIQLDQAANGPIKVNTTNGRVDLTLRGKPEDSIRAQAVNGSITLRLPSETNAHLRASTVHAPITSDFDVYEHFPGRMHGNNSVDGKLGSGGPEIELSTWNGRISVLKTL